MATYYGWAFVSCNIGLHEVAYFSNNISNKQIGDPLRLGAPDFAIDSSQKGHTESSDSIATRKK